MVRQVFRLVRKERVPEAALCTAAREILAGTLGAGVADLGDGLFKKRLARVGGGKSGGYRVIIGYRKPRTERVLFAYAFAKNAASTLTQPGHKALADAAAVFVMTDDVQVAVLVKAGEVIEVNCNAKGHGDETHGSARSRG